MRGRRPASISRAPQLGSRAYIPIPHGFARHDQLHPAAAPKTPRPGPRPAPHPALRDPNRGSLCELDQALHPVSRQTPPARDGEPRGRRLPHPPGRHRSRRRQHPESGPRRSPVPVSERPRNRAAPHRQRPGQTPQTPPRRPLRRRGPRRVMQKGGPLETHGRIDVWRRPSPPRNQPPAATS
jgi:hypothetical protein